MDICEVAADQSIPLIHFVTLGIDCHSFSEPAMHSELADAIRLFRNDQELALAYLHGKLRIPVPSTSHEWATNARDYVCAVKSIASADFVTLYPHGFGIEVTHPEFHVDFDYGPAGQCDCFDAWRLSLHRHLRLKVPNPVDDPRPIRDWLRGAVDSGHLAQIADSYSLYYNPESRSTWNPK